MQPGREPRRRGGGWTEEQAHAQFPIAYVKYHDHCWLESKELEEIQQATPYVVEETGFLLHQTPKFVTIAKERSTDGEKDKVQYDDVTIIMRSDILSLEIFTLGSGQRGVPRGKGRAQRGNGRRPAGPPAVRKNAPRKKPTKKKGGSR